MASKPPLNLAAQQALAEARRIKREKKLLEPTSIEPVKGAIIQRPWLSLVDTSAPRVKVLTWNLLAQCLVRRELFPTSTCLKASQREDMLYQEILAPDADILCLQEVDRLEKLVPVLESAGYAHHYASGPGKKHGCMIAFKQDKYSTVANHVVHYDNEEIRASGTPLGRCGASFRTKNIGLIVGLKSSANEQGFIVATTHLFWHPKYNYERARQAGILKREVVNLRSTMNLMQFPCIISGDFNFTPEDPAYSLMVGESILPDQEKKLVDSRVVHKSIDPEVPATALAAADDDDNDPDKIITNARSAIDADGLLANDELVTLFSNSSPCRSAYSEALAQLPTIRNYSDRVPTMSSLSGRTEPEWSCYAHFWKTVLDYIFIIDAEDQHLVVAGILSPHQTKDLQPALPQTGICGSDHISICAELS